MAAKVVAVSSVERNHWSMRNPLWRKYRVAKPRIPDKEKGEQNWVESHIPDSLLEFVGPTALAAHRLKAVVDAFKTKHTTPNMLLEGPSGSGKTALINCFLGELKAAFGAADRERCGVLVIAAKTAAPAAIEQAVGELIATKSGFKLVVMDEIDQVPTATQQALRKAVTQSKQTKLLFSCVSPSKVISQFREKCNRISLDWPPEQEALKVVLGILKAERVGYERQAVQLLFEHIKEPNLSRLIPLLQEVFVADYFISEINMQRRLTDGRKRKKPTIMSYAALPEPFTRCEKCTLIPPCQHISWEDLHRMGMDIRSRLPRYQGGMACQEFIKTGRCSLFLRYGHCSLDHPTNYHVVLEPIRRCPNCTLPWPCDHCAYAIERKQLLTLIQSCKDALRYLDMKSLQLSLQSEKSVGSATILDHHPRSRTRTITSQVQPPTSVETQSFFSEFNHLQQLVEEASRLSQSELQDTATHASTRNRRGGSRAGTRPSNRQRTEPRGDFSRELLVNLRVGEAMAQLLRIEEWLSGETTTDASEYRTEITALREMFDPILQFVAGVGDRDSIASPPASPLHGGHRSRAISWVESFS